MPTAFAQAILFLSSYAPLLVVFALLDSFGPGWPSMVCVGLAVLGALGLIVFWRKARGQKRTNLPLAHTRVRDNDALTYFATYLVPFVAVQAHSTRDRLALLLFLATIGVLYVRSALFYVNPLLALVGYRSFEVETEKGRPLVLLTRRSFMRQAEQVAAAQVSDYVFVELTSSGQHQVSSGRSSGTG